MVYQQEEERTRLGKRLSQEAITLAIQGRWEEAVAVNKSIIERFPNDAGAYNRLGRALMELGEFAQAKEVYSKALELAPNNAIAAKNLARLANLSEATTTVDSEHHKVASELFITETGKVGVVNLCNLASWEVLAKMGVGAQVHLEVRGQRLIVLASPHSSPMNGEGVKGEEYLGEVEPKYRLRLAKLMRGGNRYAAAILSVRGDGVQVIIREEYQHPSQAGHPSFPTTASEPLHTKELIADSCQLTAFNEGEGGYPEDEDKALPEGFSVLGEAKDLEGGIEE